MSFFSRFLYLPILVAGPFVTLSCREKSPTANSAPTAPASVPDSEKAQAKRHSSANAETQIVQKFRVEIRQLYNNRKFDELEAVAKRLHEDKERFIDGRWKIVDFYDSLECQDKEPESMWQLHEQIHKDWISKYPQSITARVAYARFMLDYAWYARGSGYANTVSEKGWELFRERLASARTILEESKSFTPSCPGWWHAMQTVALGQNWSWSKANALFKEAKAFEPEFFLYDVERAYYLLPRWHGEPGDWEAAAEEQAEKQGDLGLEIYARVVSAQARRYDNIFRESKASWRKVKKGFELLRVHYPDSKYLVNTYCRMACFAGDKKQAKALFADIGENKVDKAWGKGEFPKAKAWANAEE